MIVGLALSLSSMAVDASDIDIGLAGSSGGDIAESAWRGGIGKVQSSSAPSLAKTALAPLHHHHHHHPTPAPPPTTISTTTATRQRPPAIGHAGGPPAAPGSVCFSNRFRNNLPTHYPPNRGNGRSVGFAG
jgi:hypothetical protein